jgi:phospholipase C
MVEPRGQVRLNMAPTSPIKHVVIVVKENHGYDNYFGAFPGGNGATMARSPNPPPTDPNHRHAAWLSRDTTAPRVQFQRADIPHYWSYASQFTLCDNYFTDVAGPSTPNHLMLIMADSKLVDNPSRSYRKKPGPPVYDQPSLPSTKLPSVSWLYSDGALSEHPADTAAERAAGNGNVTKGMQWTVDQVNAVVAAGLWPNVAIFITWDDWGGWWDHVTPPEVEKWTDGTQFRYGGRVGCLVLSPYARKGYVSKTLHSHVSLIKFCETNFGLPSLNARTTASDGMVDCFDFGQTPLPPPA